MAQIGEDLVRGVDNIAAELNLKRHEVRELIARGHLRAFKFGRQWTIIKSAVVADFKRRKDLTGAIRFSKVLWRTGVHEPRNAAIMLIAQCESFHDDRVWSLGQTWLGELDNWALCDGVAPGLIAPFVQTAVPRHRSRRREVLRWTRDLNPWIRRGALLASIRSTRVDREWEFLLKVAIRLREDPEYFVQKGLGWMLRECAHHNPRGAPRSMAQPPRTSRRDPQARAPCWVGQRTRSYPSLARGAAVLAAFHGTGQ